MNCGLTVDSFFLGGQVRAITKSRILYQRGSLSSVIMEEIDCALCITLDL